MTVFTMVLFSQNKRELLILAGDSRLCALQTASHEVPLWAADGWRTRVD